MSIELNPSELASILAALRFAQRLKITPDDPEYDILVDQDTLIPLSADEIDSLCIRLNSEPVTTPGEVTARWLRQEGERGYWGQHPDYPADDWQTEVMAGDTREGYWRWLADHLDDRDEDGDEEEEMHDGRA